MLSDKWQPIESAPENTSMLVTEGEFIDLGILNNDTWFYDSGEVANQMIWHSTKLTHWMPLPELPEKNILKGE